MAKKKKVNFLAKTKTRRHVSFEAGGKEVSFKAKVASKRRRRISFLAKRGK